MAGKDGTKTCTDEGPIALKGFYGLADHPNHGIIASILKRRNRKFTLPDEVKKMCKQVEEYKTAADHLHQSLMFMLVENPTTSKQLVENVRTEPNLRKAAAYLRTYDGLNRQGRKLDSKEGKELESLEPVSKLLLNLDAEHERRVRKQLENLKPLTKLIGEDYWEYARLRKVYWDALEAFDDAVTQQNKERTEQSEQNTANAQKYRNECRQKLIDFIGKSIFDQKTKHADSVLKFRDEAVLYHRAMAELIPYVEEKKPENKSAIKPPSSK
uniref:BAR domain-containing protein n=1 Tax=Caenorhabditis tropicalis TaxID=1561998 RepID=A0A1I7UYJ4_9PELO